MELQAKLHTASNKTHERISWAMLAGLLILRLPLMTGVEYFAPIPWLDPLFELCTYVLTLCLIWWERDRLVLFHIDALSIALIIFLKPIQTLYLGFLWITVQYDNILAFPRFPSLVIWIGAAALFFVIRKKRPELLKVHKTSWRWFGIGTLVGVGQALLLGYPMSFDPTFRNSKPILLNELLPILPFFVYGLGYAAVTEEPMFRGFLWGHLRKAGWNEWGICLFQAVLFALGHLYYLSQMPISFWVIVPVSGLVFGLLAWKSRTIASSMAAHGIFNALAGTVARFSAAYIH